MYSKNATIKSANDPNDHREFCHWLKAEYPKSRAFPFGADRINAFGQ